jgi:endonuclease YncB( thermonuclease family)
VDGDTVHLEVDMGFRNTCQHYFRVLGIDTPELRGGTAEQKEAANEAKFRAEVLLTGRDPDYGFGQTEWPLTIRTEKADSFGRYLADIFIDDEVSLSQILLEEGHAVPYGK